MFKYLLLVGATHGAVDKAKDLLNKVSDILDKINQGNGDHHYVLADRFKGHIEPCHRKLRADMKHIYEGLRDIKGKGAEDEHATMTIEAHSRGEKAKNIFKKAEQMSGATYGHWQFCHDNHEICPAYDTYIANLKWIRDNLKNFEGYRKHEAIAKETMTTATTQVQMAAVCSLEVMAEYDKR